MAGIDPKDMDGKIANYDSGVMSGGIKKDGNRLDSITLWKDSGWPDGTITRSLDWMDGATARCNDRNGINVKITGKESRESGTIAKRSLNWLDGATVSCKYRNGPDGAITRSLNWTDGATVSCNYRNGINVKINDKEGRESGTIAKRSLNGLDGATVSCNCRNRINVRITCKDGNKSESIAKRRLS